MVLPSMAVRWRAAIVDTIFLPTQSDDAVLCTTFFVGMALLLMRYLLSESIDVFESLASERKDASLRRKRRS